MFNNNNPCLIVGYGILGKNGHPSLVSNGSDDVAALLGKNICNSLNIYLKDSGGIYSKSINGKANGRLLECISCKDLYNEVTKGVIKKVISKGAAKVHYENKIPAHVCGLDNWLKGTWILPFS